MSNAKISSNALNDFYAQLTEAGFNEDYEKAIKLSNKVLQLDNSLFKVFHFKIVCLIKAAKFDQCLKCLKSNEKLSLSLWFEKAYCEYRCNLNEECLNTIKIYVESGVKKALELKAQLLYRLERYQETLDLYKSFLIDTKDGFEDERQTNLEAVVSSLTLENQDYPYTCHEHANCPYERLYNRACINIARGNFHEALDLLHRAQDLCQKTLQEEGATHEEVVDESAIIRVQILFCRQKLSKSVLENSTESYQQILRNRPSDVAVVSVAANNILVANADQSVFDSKKRLRSILNGQYKLTHRQNKQINLNKCIFSYISHQKPGDISKQLDEFCSQYSDSVYFANVLRACEMANADVNEAVTYLLEEASSCINEDHSFYMRLSAVQLLINKRIYDKALDILLSFNKEIRLRAGCISTCILLCNKMSHFSKAISIILEALDSTLIDASLRQKLLCVISDLYLTRNDHVQAAIYLDSLHKLYLPGCQSGRMTASVVIAKLVIALCHCDLARAKLLHQQLPDIGDTSGGGGGTTCEDVDTLLSSAYSSSSRARKYHVSGIPAEDVTATYARLNNREIPNIKKNKKRQKRKKTRIPKNADLNVTPDPERWLPKHERSSYKPHRRKRAQNEHTRGAQGICSHADMYDITKTAPQTKISTSDQSVAQKPANKNIQKKRKQRKNKW